MYCIERESAMGNKPKLCILGNELTRRLLNVDAEMKEEELEEEVTSTIERFTKQAKNSGWEIKETREMVISGVIGWKRRLRRRIEENGCMYRSGASTLHQRTRKKLTGKED